MFFRTHEACHMSGRSVLWVKSHCICDSLCKLLGLWLDEIKLTAGVSNVSPTLFFDIVACTIFEIFLYRVTICKLVFMELKLVLVCRDQDVALSRH